MFDPARLHSSRRQAGVLMAALAALLLLSPGTARAADGVVNVAQGSDVPSLDPTADTSPIGINVRKNVFSQLTDINRDGSVRPDLATSWVAAENATSWVFTLRQNVKFQDGSPVTADDVVWTYQKIMADPKSPVNSYLSKSPSGKFFSCYIVFGA